MMELTNEYQNILAQQLVFICTFLGGFSATILGTLIVSEISTKYSRIMVVTSSLAALCFIVTIFGMTDILFKTTVGYPLPVDQQSLMIVRSVAMLSMIIGMLSFMVCISTSGWMISKKIGRFTTVIGVIALISIMLMSS